MKYRQRTFRRLISTRMSAWRLESHGQFLEAGRRRKRRFPVLTYRL
jgi:hypothetical protein